MHGRSVNGQVEIKNDILGVLFVKVERIDSVRSVLSRPGLGLKINHLVLLLVIDSLFGLHSLLE